MIRTTKKILKKLIDNASGYEIYIEKRHYPFDCLEQKLNDLEWFIMFSDLANCYVITITDTKINWRLHRQQCGDIGCLKTAKLSEDSKYELFDLCQKLKQVCEDYTLTGFRTFADSEHIEPNNID